jgi:RNA polymerase sigma-70 factor, ECF subfamily
MLHDSFAELIEAAKEGSDEAWAELLEPVAPKLVGYLRLRGSRDPEATAGDVFIDVARNIESFTGTRESFTSWVFVIAHRRLIDAYRRDLVRPDELLTDQQIDFGIALSAEEEALHSVSAEEVTALLATLTAPQRDVIFLRVIAELTLDETAGVLNRPVSSVKALQRRGLASLRRHIEQTGVSR